VLTEQDVTVISAINFYTRLNEHHSVVPSSDTTTDTMTDFEKVDRVRRRGSADTCFPVGFQLGHTGDRSESVFSISETSVFEFHF